MEETEATTTEITTELREIKKDIRIIKYVAIFFCILTLISLICMFVVTSKVNKAVTEYQKLVDYSSYDDDDFGLDSDSVWD